ncbi:MAG: hypothetical protein ACI3T9_05050 [Romboutsia timonensis]
MNISEFIKFIKSREYFKMNLIDEDLSIDSQDFLCEILDGIYNEVNFEECFFIYLRSVKEAIDTHCDGIVAEICFDKISRHIEQVGEALESVYNLAKDNIDLLDAESKRTLCW